jgi:general secretion pathway protein G
VALVDSNEEWVPVLASTVGSVENMSMSRNADRSSARPDNHAFTLVEILIVVAILGILAAIVVPQFISAASAGRDNSLKMDLFRIRTQLEIYKEQHGQYPVLANFEAQMTMASNAAGNTAAPWTIGYPLGPYIRAVPVNPNTLGNTVGAGAVGSSDWYYDDTTNEFHPNDSAQTRAY